MHYIPSYCDTCEHTALIPERVIENGTSRCTGCRSGTARPLPGESYGADDVPLFDDLRDALREAGIGRENAAALASQLEIRNAEQPGRGLRRLAHIVPSLGILELIVANRPDTMRRAEGMLATLLDALANGRRHSSLIPPVPVVSAAPIAKASGDAS